MAEELESEDPVRAGGGRLAGSERVRAAHAVLLGVLLALAGLAFGTPSLIVPGIGLVLIAASAVAWVELSRPRAILRAPGPATLVEGERYPLAISCEGWRIGPPGGELRDGALAAPLRIGPRWRGVVKGGDSLEGRGARRLGAATLEIRDPLGLHSRSVSSADAGEVLVLPRIEPLAYTDDAGGPGRRGPRAGIEDGLGAQPLDARALELEVDGLRRYRAGTPASRIHWPAVARTGELIERRLVSGSDTVPLVVLDASAPATEPALDAAVRAAASLAFHLASAAGCAVLLPGDRRPAEVAADLHRWPAVHARLALVEAVAEPPRSARAARSGLIFWVSAAADPRLPAALRAPGAARYLIGPCVPAARGRTVFTVAGCTGVRAGGARRGAARAA